MSGAAAVPPGLFERLRAAWSAETSKCPGTWRAESPERGQAWATACALRWALGGEVVEGAAIPPRGPQVPHAWNRLPDGSEVDLLRHAFPAGTTFSDRPCDTPDARLARQDLDCDAPYRGGLLLARAWLAPEPPPSRAFAP